jgi:NAD(P)-dependent dehydrogenase (short-subunit alcohol dehydrogenase family)
MRNKMKQRLWFITGISSGLGKALISSVIQNGDFAIGTFRNEEQVKQFNSIHSGKAFSMKMDVTNSGEVKKAFDDVAAKFGRLDVLVNNAGFGFAGAIEETQREETKKIFDTNFFGTLEVTQFALPIFRAQKSGHIIQISSHGGIKGFAGFGLYNASKFAVEGFSEALAQEVAPLGIKVTIIEPGPFRTNFAGEGFGFAKHEIEDYRLTAGEFRKRIKSIHGKQDGDPADAARTILEVVNCEVPPLRLPLGKTALATFSAKIESMQNDLSKAQKITGESVL